MDINLTSTWIPMTLLAVLSIYMFILFRRERREALAFEGMAFEGHAIPATSATPAIVVPVADHGLAVPAAPAPAAVHDHAPAQHAPMAPAPTKKKVSLVWRTAYLWLPLVAGFGGQAYLDIIKPMLEKTAG